MPNVTQLAHEIVAREGGFVNDPSDPGGPTNHGVTLATMARLGIDLTGDGKTDIRDVKAISQQQAIELFVEHYFNEPGIARLPSALQASVFDMYVNAGGAAIRILQGLLNDMHIDVAIDGSIGPLTAAAAAQAWQRAPDHLVDAYGIARRNYYYHLGDVHKSLRKYDRRRDGGKGGWILRAETFISSRFHLSASEHNARVSAWG